jgi:hypothetical protein
MKTFAMILVFCIAISPLHSSADREEYLNVVWISAQSDGDIGFKLADTKYYTCSTKAKPRQCLSILLTAIAADREVKVFATRGMGSSDSPYIVRNLRIH